MTDIDFLLTALELKEETRTGWELRGVEDPESVAAHSWGVALLAFLFADEAGVDRDRAIQLALVHDIHEAVTGDIASEDLSAEEQEVKAEKEREGFRKLLGHAGQGSDALERRWEEYEAGETAAARFVNDLDRIDAALQALRYEEADRYGDDGFSSERGDAFIDDVAAEMDTEMAKQLLDAVAERYTEVKQ